MITKEIAMTCPREMWHNTLKNADGTPVRLRSTGQCKTWKTRPEEFKLPVKHGLRDHFYLDATNSAEWSLPGRWPLERHWG